MNKYPSFYCTDSSSLIDNQYPGYINPKMKLQVNLFCPSICLVELTQYVNDAKYGFNNANMVVTR